MCLLHVVRLARSFLVAYIDENSRSCLHSMVILVALCINSGFCGTPAFTKHVADTGGYER